MKTYITKFYILLFFILFVQNAFSSEKIKIGLIVPLSGEYSYIGSSIINSVHLAINKIDSDKIEILPRDNNSNPNLTFKAAKDLYDNHNVRIIIGPIFKENNLYLNKLPNVTFLTLSNKMTNNNSNIISAGINAISQINAIKKFQLIKKLERTIFLVPNSDYKNEIEDAIKFTKIRLKDKYNYDTDPTLLTSQIEKITRYPQRKQNLIDEIERIENSNDLNKDKKIEKLKKRDTLGGINFDSVIIGDFDENLKSVATSLLYTDVSSDRVYYICLNQWFDETLIGETSLQPLYFPSINKENFTEFVKQYEYYFKEMPTQISFLSYDLMGLVYYLIYKNSFNVDKKIFYEESRFKGKTGIFEIKENKITHELSFYSVENKQFKKIF